MNNPPPKPMEKCTNQNCIEGQIPINYHRDLWNTCPTCKGTGQVPKTGSEQSLEKLPTVEIECPARIDMGDGTEMVRETDNPQLMGTPDTAGKDSTSGQNVESISLEAQAPSNSANNKSLGVIFREAYDEYWVQNEPKHAFGTPGYYEWYLAQDEFIGKKIADFVLTDYRYVEFMLSRRDALSSFKTPADKIAALLSLCQKLDPLAIEMAKIASPVAAPTLSPSDKTHAASGEKTLGQVVYESCGYISWNQLPDSQNHTYWENIGKAVAAHAVAKERDDNAATRWENGELRQQLSTAQATINKERNLGDKLASALKSVEWGRNGDYCCSCGRFKPDCHEHYPKCQVAKALSAYESSLKSSGGEIVEES